MNSKLKSVIIACRNAVIGFLYKYVLKPILFLFDPEDVHDLFLTIGKFLGRHSLMLWKTRVWLGFADKSLEQNVAGIHFKNPIGLAAGFDKNAELLDILPSVGFGFAEVGSITGFPCAGNPKPRLWRLPKSRGLVVYYGLKNNGCEEISARLRGQIKDNIGRWTNRQQAEVANGHAESDGNVWSGTLGVSVAMTNRPENLDADIAIADYAKAFGAFADIADYITVNISCPNAQGGMPFLEPENLDALFSKLDTIQ